MNPSPSSASVAGSGTALALLGIGPTVPVKLPDDVKVSPATSALASPAVTPLIPDTSKQDTPPLAKV